MKKGISILVMSVCLLASGLFFAGCSTIPAGSFSNVNLAVDEILGPIPGTFSSYEAALAAAKEAYPEAQGVVFFTATAGDKKLPKKIALGYYAVTLKVVEVKKFLGLF